jgi:SWI/SNF-related matrix-associated actin-dependent regulator of chromatin subfamily A3
VKVKQAANSLAAYPKHVPVALDSVNLLSCWTNNGDLSFEISDNAVIKILSELGAAVELSTQLYCYSAPRIPPNDKRKGNDRRRIARSWFLNIIIYGPPALEESIGDFFTQQHIYLQDPLGCDRRVVYRNPHIIQPEAGHEIMTDGIESSLGNLEIERLEVGPNLLEKLMEDEVPLVETEAPHIIRTTLFPWVKLTHLRENIG